MSPASPSIRMPGRYRRRRQRRQRGQGSVEYGLVLLLVAIALIGSLLAMQAPLQDLFDAIVNGFPGAGGA